jgi:dihydroorotate dehydrogenase (NAD+) catalytic subunit
MPFLFLKRRLPQKEAFNMTDFQTKIGSVELASPILNASGTFNPSVFSRLFSLKSHLGAIVTKTVTPNASSGNPQQRTVELPGIGMLNSIGLQGKGIITSMDVDIPQYYGCHGLPVILSISADSEVAFQRMTAYIEAHANRRYLHGIEVNVSCPNVHAGGALFGASPQWVEKAVHAVRQETTLPLWVKLTPNTTEVVAVAQASVDAGADALTAINTVLGSHIDIRRRTPSLAKVSGGYSGQGIKPIAIHHVLNIAKALPNTPIVGVGGIHRAEDVLEFLMAGATAVQVGTHCFSDPAVFVDLVQDLDTWCLAEGVASLQELVGVALP